jgi:hypothetical protein
LSASATAIDTGSVGTRSDGALRLVVILDRGGHAFGCSPWSLRIFAAHQALQLGELADHLGDEVGLGESRGLFGEVRIGVDERRQLPRQRRDPGYRGRLALPSLLWKVMAFSPSSHSPIPAFAIFRSFSKKNRASDRRARHARFSLPATMVVPP